MNKYTFIFKSNGYYLGFIFNDFLFSRDGVYLGWIEGNFVWDTAGKFRGSVTDITGQKYVLINRFTIPPVPRSPKPAPQSPVLPNPPANIQPVSLPLGFIDSF